MLSTIKTRVLPLSWILSIPLLGLIYSTLNNSTRGAHSLMTDLDRSIPFVKSFILPYVGWEFFLFLTLIYFGLKDRGTYKRILLAMNVSLILSYVIYYFYQTSVPRPELVGSDWLTVIVRFVYKNDAPFNCFPSIHTLTSFLMIRGIQGSPVKNFWNTTIITGGAICIILSTLFVKQHVIFDVIGAMLLGEIVLQIVSRLNQGSEVRSNAWIKKPSLS